MHYNYAAVTFTIVPRASVTARVSPRAMFAEDTSSCATSGPSSVIVWPWMAVITLDADDYVTIRPRLG